MATWQRFRVWLILFLLAVGLTGLTASCQFQAPLPDGRPAQVNLTLSGFSVTKKAHEAIMPLFAAQWEQEHQQKVRFRTSYGASGSQSRAVIDGLEADIVHLSLGLDVDRIVKAGLIDPDWTSRAPNNSIVTTSVCALITREGNPKNLQTWQDLTREGVTFVTADPKTSGAARWNFLALWGSITQTGGTFDQARQFVTAAFRHVAALPRDGREATDAFLKQGQGDALINYENEVILARRQGQTLSYEIPPVNILIENPIALVDKYADQHGTREVAQAYIDFLYTPQAQEIFAQYGFRPVDATVLAAHRQVFPPVPNLFTVADLGGWEKVQAQFFANGALFDQIQQENQA
ncbi:sulfate ABC transporter substrate-binding protein [Thermosynechococcus vestitus]|uniref:Sulfate transport system substrate-binding protein n=1 Tax=Thermosynechococcus vestitus (strain NIES-2133 / IAM M-273 / BP-1) TaxID=197221 RepID=Q8DM49_THEVB|nr:sulfate ABC transporter substrate-binding protein [Thermosynechococcus vestitus]BAC07827.1 sulfate transport system substrate-binding protein [Thermosynechococcus vestitus BP-1]BAY52294.1 sulfate transport system substrate-binding protein [Thermostichus vulcanus NIES-2134]